MKRLATLITALLLALAVPANAQLIDVDEYRGGDRAVLARTVEVPVLQHGEPGLKAFQGYVAYVGGEWLLFFQSQSSDWIFDDVPTAYILADGEGIKIELQTAGDKWVRSGDLRHDFVAPMDNARLRTEIATASRVRMRLGDYIFDITDMVDQEIRAIQYRISQ